MALDEHLRVQNALVNLARSGTFYKCAYDQQQRLVMVMDGGMPPAPVEVEPASVLAEQVTKTFAPATRNRRIPRLDRVPSTGHSSRRDVSEWTWELRVAFSDTVLTGTFEAYVAEHPILLPASNSENLRQVTIEIGSVVYDSTPPTQSPRNGTKVTYTVSVTLSPI